jgi:hypothetical protein
VLDGVIDEVWAEAETAKAAQRSSVKVLIFIVVRFSLNNK